MSCWLTDPDLFLYAKGTGSDDVHLWRCKKPVSSSSSSSLVMPMKSDDFDYVSNVENHMELIADLLDWDETDYKRLVKYIFERRLLVNSLGFVIAELLHKVVDQDGNKMIDDANKEVPIYIRSLDVLALKPYIPELRERPIPLRTVQILEDVNGKAVVMEDFNVTKLTARVADLESQNKTLDFNVTKLTTRVENLEAENTRLESKNNTLDTSVTKLTADLATTKGNVADLQCKNKTLDSNVKTLEGKVTKLTADLATALNTLATLQGELKGVLENPNFKEVWMNDLTNTEWVGIEKLRADVTPRKKLTIIKLKGSFTRDDNSTNVQARYWYTIKVDALPTEFKAVSIEDLTPNKEKSRFLQDWWCIKSLGKTYVLHSL